MAQKGSAFFAAWQIASGPLLRHDEKRSGEAIQIARRGAAHDDAGPRIVAVQRRVGGRPRRAPAVAARTAGEVSRSQQERKCAEHKASRDSGAGCEA